MNNNLSNNLKNNLSNNLKLLSGVLVSLVLFGCGDSHQTTSSTSPPEQKNQNPPPPDGVKPPDNSKQPIPGSVDVSSHISGGSFDKMQVVRIDPDKKELILHLPLGMNPFILPVAGGVSDFPDITFRTEVLPTGQTRLAIRVPLKYVMRGIKGLDPKKLPNGDPLPGVASGEMPGLALTLDSERKVQMALYLGADFVAIFVESPLDPGFSFMFPLKDSNGNKIVGVFALVQEKNTTPKSQGGFFLSYQLSPQISAILDEYVFSKAN